MNTGRRNLLKFLGGAAAGTMLSPMPWKLVSDSALWSQNWSWIPRVPHGDLKVKYSTCSLCPASCGLEVRCVGEQPFALAGLKGHPLSQGTLCPLGLAAHQLPYHPRRVSMPLVRTGARKHVPVPLEDSLAAIRRAIAERGSGELVAVLDERPGRTMSMIYRRTLGAMENAVYVTPPSRERVTLDAVAELAGDPELKLGFDLKNAGAIISFGAPVLDGWGIPAHVIAARYRSGSPMKVVSVETKQSRTASLADVWLPVKPGTEALIADAIADVLAGNGAVDEAAKAAGVPSETIVEAAELLRKHSPAVAIGGGDPGSGPAAKAQEMAVARLNFALNAVGRPGGILAQEAPPLPKSWKEWKLAPATRLEDVPDHSIAVLLLGDSASGDAIPWTLIDRKLTPVRNLVVSLAPYVEGPARRAHYILPSPAFLEGLEELPTPPTSNGVSLAYSAALLKPPSGAVDPAVVMAKLSGLDCVAADLMKERAAAVFDGKRGSVNLADGNAKAMTEFKDADELWAAFQSGAIWTVAAETRTVRMKADANPATVQATLLPDDAAYPLVLMPYAYRGACGSGALPPLMTKVYQESLLRGSAHQCRIHPSTAAELQIADGENVALETRCGSCQQVAWIDASVMPGVVEVPAGPQGTRGESNILDVCGLDKECNWRASRVRVRRLA